MKLSLINFLCNKNRNMNSSFLCILKTTNLTFSLKILHATQAILVRVSETLIWKFHICIGDMIKDQFWLFLFLKMQKYPSSNQRKKTSVYHEDFVLCHETEFCVKTMSLTTKLWDLASMLQLGKLLKTTYQFGLFFEELCRRLYQYAYWRIRLFYFKCFRNLTNKIPENWCYKKNNVSRTKTHHQAVKSTGKLI